MNWTKINEDINDIKEMLGECLADRYYELFYAIRNAEDEEELADAVEEMADTMEIDAHWIESASRAVRAICDETDD